MKIKAYAIKEKGGKAEPFVYESNLGNQHVLVKITHCGIARGDIQAIADDWQDTKFPKIPGHEMIGIVEAAGSAVTDLKIGDRVGIGYQQEACFEYQFCKAGEEQFRPEQKVIAVDCFGGLAEHIIVDNRFAFRLPATLNSAKSVPLLSSGLTVYSAIVRAELQNNSTVAVSGVGGLGYLAIQFLKKMGHQVSAFSHLPEKQALFSQAGVEYINSSSLQDLPDHQRNFDFILSTLNSSFALDTYLLMLKPQGKFCFVASPLDKLSISPGLLYDYAQRTIYGNYVGSRSHMVKMLEFSAEHCIESRIAVMPFSEMNEAIEMVRGGKGFGRLVLENGGEVW